jgi:hypothetical protein
VNARGAPERIRGGHLPDQGGNLRIDGRTVATGPAGELCPVVTEVATLPSQDGVGRHDDGRFPPARPRSGQADPEQTIHRVEPGPGRRSLVVGELLAQGQVLEGELAVAPTRKPEQVEDHEPRCGRTGPAGSITCLANDLLAKGWSRRVIIELVFCAKDPPDEAREPRPRPERWSCRPSRLTDESGCLDSAIMRLMRLMKCGRGLALEPALSERQPS